MSLNDYDAQGWDSDHDHERADVHEAFDAYGCAEQNFSIRKTPRRLSPESRAAKYGYNFREAEIVGRWLGLLLDEAPLVRDALDFWRACHIVKWIASPVETQEQLAARLGVSQPYIAKLVIKFSEKIADVSRS